MLDRQRMTDRTRWKLLAEHAEIMNVHGPDSPQARRFEDAYADDDELTSLMMVARSVKRAYQRKP